jgi:hypothetical protein
MGPTPDVGFTGEQKNSCPSKESNFGFQLLIKLNLEKMFVFLSPR